MPPTNTAAHLLRCGIGDGDTALLLGGMSPEYQASLVEGIGSTVELYVAEATAASTAAHATLEEQDSLGLAQYENARLAQALKSSDHLSASCLKPIKFEVVKFGAQSISDQATRMAFAMSHLKWRAEDWAFSKRFANPLCFPSFATFEAEIKAMFLPPNSDFRYPSQYLACKQGKRSL
ncbi:hypothetical protein H257_07046 [Aphanomyces astaci]|uniref:Uncharacterized protein n=1 Tax=Aphanomyces astaci TaxID=112090 RepID=W4GJE7_APHAT|nr:hypothetical protein H257_07046 [Aphanomyces astaci]ETV79830.1 hypothetical protein H257_07046 [Aphanomyces astaci]|eukprot:XP_009830766.1 hypothetical protein H257_07046 [Aphanomyces astaci]